MMFAELKSVAAGAAIEVGTDKLSALDEKPGLIGCMTDLVLDSAWSLKGPAGAAALVVQDHYVEVFNAFNSQLVEGRKWLEALDGHFLFLMWVLNRASSDDQDIAQNTAETGVVQVRIPQNFPWDLDEYSIPVDEIQNIKILQGGSSGMQTVTSVATKLYIKGRFKAARSPKKRQWLMFDSTDTDTVLPAGGRYHFIAIVNDKGSNANMYDGGLSLTAENAGYSNVDGRVLNRLFAEQYNLADLMYSAADDESATLEDLLQIVYCPDKRSMRYDDGLRGRVKIHNHDTGLSAHKVIALRTMDF